jgi:hypothetical protein
MSAWHSLYVFTSLPLENTLSDWLKNQGYTRYDPFNTLGGASYPQAMRLFLAPTVDDVTRILVECNQAAPVLALAADLSSCGPCLSLRLDGTAAHIVLYHDGKETQDWTMIAKRGVTSFQIDAARQPGTAQVSQPSSVIPVEDMPASLQTMAQTVSQYQVGRLFQKMAFQVMSRTQQTAAEKFLQGLPRWDSSNGRMLTSCMNLLRVSKTWRDPDFPTLRTAYWLHLRRRTQPNAPLLPGDDNALRRVPDALTYKPLYGGKA